MSLKPAIICIDDQREVLAAIQKDLMPLMDKVDVIDCESVNEAMENMSELEHSGQSVIMVISDHMMPEKTGLEFLAELRLNDHWKSLKLILLTGYAAQGDLIDANENVLDASLSKPWEKEHLLQTVLSFLEKDGS
jgi:two-component system chemotaxis response regulator CheY